MISEKSLRQRNFTAFGPTLIRLASIICLIIINWSIFPPLTVIGWILFAYGAFGLLLTIYLKNTSKLPFDATGYINDRLDWHYGEELPHIIRPGQENIDSRPSIGMLWQDAVDNIIRAVRAKNPEDKEHPESLSNQIINLIADVVEKDSAYLGTKKKRKEDGLTLIFLGVSLVIFILKFNPGVTIDFFAGWFSLTASTLFAIQLLSDPATAAMNYYFKKKWAMRHPPQTSHG